MVPSTTHRQRLHLSMGSGKKLPKLKISKTIKISSPIETVDDAVDEAMMGKAHRERPGYGQPHGTLARARRTYMDGVVLNPKPLDRKPAVGRFGWLPRMQMASILGP